MLCDRLQRELLQARDRRSEIIDRMHPDGQRSLILVSLAIPGANKAPRGSLALFHSAVAELLRIRNDVRLRESWSDALGQAAILSSNGSASVLKHACITIEESHECARLLDLDVYDQSGVQIDRKSIGHPPRNCLLCDQPAVDCIRLKRHAPQSVVQHAFNLLRTFADARPGR